MIYTNVDEYLEQSGHGIPIPSSVPASMGQLQVVATSGAFDIITPGHIQLLEYCRRLGTYVIVLLNTDESIQGYKGEHRPVKPWMDRAVILDNITSVEDVIGMAERDPIAAIRKLKPDVWVKGNRPAAEVVELYPVLEYGGTYVSVWTDCEQSSTGYIEKAAETYLAETSEIGVEPEKVRNIPEEMLKTLGKDKPLVSGTSHDLSGKELDIAVEQFFQHLKNKGWTVKTLAERWHGEGV